MFKQEITYGGSKTAAVKESLTLMRSQIRNVITKDLLKEESTRCLTDEEKG